MRVPDETKYKAGEKHIEDIKGWVYCCHCMHCPINHQDAIYTDGRFWCSLFKEWKRGDDLFEYKCPGYKQKQCSNCHNYRCDIRNDKSGNLRDRISYCNKYRRDNRDRQERFYGRRRVVSERAASAEERYIKDKEEEYARLSNNQRYGIKEAGKYPEEEKGDAGMERVQISDSNKEDQIDFFA